MPVIELTTKINAPIEICFDLSRSIDLHKLSIEGTREEAIAGVTSGLIGLNEEVTWRATHFGVRQTLSSKITKFNYPYHFRDEMLKGAFKKIEHDHYFEKVEGGTIMKDRFEFESPGGILGTLFNKLVLTSYPHGRISFTIHLIGLRLMPTTLRCADPQSSAVPCIPIANIFSTMGSFGGKRCQRCDPDQHILVYAEWVLTN